MKRIKLVQLDGRMPNLALMKLTHWHRSRGGEVRLTRSAQPTLFDQEGVDIVYGSAIFSRSIPLAEELRAVHPDAILGGTGSGRPLSLTVEQTLGLEEYSYERYDYSIYPEYPLSIGFTQRGCRLSCPFCVVPRKEGRPVGVNTIGDIWRPGTERCVVLLDNDFFGQPPEEWRGRIQELKEGGFSVNSVNFNQGINVRAITEETARAIASVRYCDHQFKRRRLHTAWDNLGHERAFLRGVERLEAAGVPARRLMVYMLVGFDPDETMERALYRFQRLDEMGCKVFPMVFQEWEERDEGEEKKPGGTELPETPEEQAEREKREQLLEDLRRFQRWVICRYSQFVPWEKFNKGSEHDRKAREMQEMQPQMPSLFDFSEVGFPQETVWTE